MSEELTLKPGTAKQVNKALCSVTGPCHLHQRRSVCAIEVGSDCSIIVTVRTTSSKYNLKSQTGSDSTNNLGEEGERNILHLF